MKKSTYIYLIAGMVIVAICCGAFDSKAYAQEESENKVVRFFKNVINWPFGITKKSSEAVGRTTKRAVTTGTTTASSAVEMVGGKPEKLETVVTEPVKGGGETAYTAVEGSVKAPIEGTEEAFNPEEAE